MALAVAGVLVLAMTGMFMGLSKSYTAFVDRSPAAVIILPPGTDSMFGNNAGQPRRIIPAIFGHADVIDVQVFNFSFAVWSNFPTPGQAAKSTGVQVLIVDPVPGAVTLPSDFEEEVIQALQVPYGVVVDRSSFGELGVHVGDIAKLNGSRVWIRAATVGYSSFFLTTVFMSRQTARLLHLLSDDQRVGPLVVKLKYPLRARQVADELNAASNGQFKAWTREDLSNATQKSMLEDGSVSVFLGFAVLIGAFIGIVITWQTLQGAIMANIKEFAGMRALGVSMFHLRLIILELSLWVGVSGLGLTICLTAIVRSIASFLGIPMNFPIFVIVPVALALLVIAVLSGTMSLGVLKKSQPVDLLR